MDIQFILNMSPPPKSSKRSHCFSEPDINIERPSKRTSYPNILNGQPSSAPPKIPDFLGLQASLDSIMSAVQSKSSATTLPPIFVPLDTATFAWSRRNPPYLPSAETRMSLKYICSDRALPPVSYTPTAAPSAQLDLNAQHQPTPTKQDPIKSTGLDLNSPDFESLEDYVPPKLVVSPATFDDFKQLNLEQLEAYDYIDIVAPSSLRTARVAFANNFEIITFDLSNMPDGEFYEIAPQAGWLILTSSCPRQLIVKDKLSRSTRSGPITPFDFRVLVKSIGFRPKAKAQADGMYWVWEKNNFDGLSWTWQLPEDD